MASRVASTNCSMGNTLRTRCLRISQLETTSALRCCRRASPMDCRQVFSQKPRMHLFLKQSSARSTPPRFYRDSRPQFTIIESRGSALKAWPAKLPPTQSRKTALRLPPNSRFTPSRSSMRSTASQPRAFSAWSCTPERLSPTMVRLSILRERYWTIILLTLEAAALSSTWAALRSATMSQSPMTESGLMENMESSWSERAVRCGQRMSSWGCATRYSEQVPLVMLARTETRWPRREWSSASSTTPAPSKPITGKPSLRKPYMPVQKLRSEGLIGAYFMRIRSCPAARVGSGQVVRRGVLPYFSMWITLIQYLSNAFRLQMKHNAVTLPFLLSLLALVVCLHIEEGLPLQESSLLPDTLKSFQVEEGQSFVLECSPEASVLGKLHNECHIHSAFLEIETLEQIEYENSPSKKYLYAPEQSALLVLDDAQLVIHSLGQGHHQLKDKESILFSSNCSKDMAFEFARQKLFVFSCEAVFEVDMQQPSPRAAMVMRNEQQVEIRSARRFEDLFVVITRVGVVLYAVDLQLNLVRLGPVQLPQQQPEIVDSYFSQQRLILVDRYDGLLYFKRSKNEFSFEDKLEFELDQDVEYASVEVWNNSTFVVIEAETESLIAELQTIKTKLYLVRYYKGYDEILKAQIINESLVVHSNSRIDVFPVNRDPRNIKHALNGYSYSHDESLLSFTHLTDDRFLVLRARSATLTQWRRIQKKIECEFSQAGMFSIMLEHPCSSAESVSGAFRESCQQVTVASVEVYHKDTYIWLLLIIVGAFISAVLLLICWREKRVAKIVQVLTRIKNFQQRKKEIEFKEVRQAEVTTEKGKENDDFVILEHKEGQQEMDPYEEYMQSERNNLT